MPEAGMITVSMLSSYLYCKRKLYLQYVMGLSEPPKESLVMGQIKHEVYDLFNKTECEMVSSIKKEEHLEKVCLRYHYHLSQILRERIIRHKTQLKLFNLNLSNAFKQTWPLIKEEGELRANNVFRFMESSQLSGEELWEKLTPKIESELEIVSHAYNLKGVIDKLEIYPEAYIPIELKSGKCPKEGVWPSHLIQISAYALLVEERFNTKINEGIVIYVDERIKRRIKMNPFLMVDVKETIYKTNNLLQSGKIPDFCRNDNKCKACSLKMECYAQKCR